MRGPCVQKIKATYRPGKSHGRRSLVGCSPWGRLGSDMTKQLHFHFSLSCIGEGNGNPLQCSCLGNPRDRRAWWAAISGVAQSQTRLKRLSSSRAMKSKEMLVAITERQNPRSTENRTVWHCREVICLRTATQHSRILCPSISCLKLHT